MNGKQKTVNSPKLERGLFIASTKLEIIKMKGLQQLIKDEKIFSEEVAKKETARSVKALREKTGFGFGLGMMGMIGLVVSSSFGWVLHWEYGWDKSYRNHFPGLNLLTTGIIAEDYCLVLVLKKIREVHKNNEKTDAMKHDINTYSFWVGIALGILYSSVGFGLR